MRKPAFLLSVATIAIATPVQAQDVPATPADAQMPAQGTAAGSVAGQTPGATDAETTQAEQPVNAGDIIITATRRAERLSNVPIAVSAVSQESLENSGATDIRQMTQLTPSLLVSSTGSEANASARIRGVGTVGDNPGLESSVAVFIDGVYRSRTGSGLNDLGEVDRIEVLRGPQGTLSGRNASAGTINIVTKAPSYTFGGYGEASYGNYNAVRAAAALTGPIVKDVLAFRIDGVYNRRDGFYHDVINDTDYNDRKRFFVKGQLLFEPTADISVRLIGDYTWRDEKCCGAVYIDMREKIDPTPGVPGDFAVNPAGNRIVNIMQRLGAVFPSAGDPYNRRIANSPGKAYSNVTKDYGGSGQIDWNLGGASLTSITAYREYKSGGASDLDYGNLDIADRPDNGNNYRQFRTFSQELRLNGEAFGGRLNWLIGGYYAKEKLQVVDNLVFGSQYGRFASCRVVSGLPTAISAFLDTTQSSCLTAAGKATLVGGLTLAQLGGTTAGRTPAQIAAAAGAAQTFAGGLARLDGLNSLGSIRDVYNQDSENYAFFTHNIIKITDRLSITGGLRYTHERKKFDANFTNNNTLCPAQQAALAPLLTNAALATGAGGIITLTCTGNSSSALNALSLNDRFSESQLTGTGVLSWKPVDSVLAYASYSRGYKAGGYNLDRSDLGTALFPRSNADVGNLRFDPETVNAYEVGLKYTSRDFTFNFAGFRQQFKNFQLNTFNGTNYVVENIGSCSDSLNGADQDQSAATGRCTGNVNYGVLSQGFEMEAGFYPVRNFGVNLGYTFAHTRFRRDLVGSDAGAPLDPSLFLLAGRDMSNAPLHTVTTSVSWTPDLGSSGLTGLFYVDSRTVSDYNTGSDLFPEKIQDGFTLVNARIGVRGRDQMWALEVWAQNLLNQDYEQVAFNAPFQGSGSQAQVQRFGGVGNQIFTSFLAEPRTYGLTARVRF